jgi:hypothetical protein
LVDHPPDIRSGPVNREEVVRSLYDHHDPDLALEFVTRLGRDLQDEDCPPEVRQLGRTIVRWREQIAAWHQAHVSNGPTEAANNLIKRIERVALGFRRFAHYRIRVRLYAGRPNWDLLATVTPRRNPKRRVTAAVLKVILRPLATERTRSFELAPIPCARARGQPMDRSAGRLGAFGARRYVT